MKFTQRLAYYLLGVLIGGMFLVFFFGQKKTRFCYFPNCRVLKELRNKPLLYSNTAEQKLAEDWVDIEDIRNCLTHGKIDFSESKGKVEKGTFYVIRGKNTNNEPITVEMVNYDERVMLYDVKKD